MHIKVLKQLNLPHPEQVSLSDEKGDLDRATRPWELVPAGHRIGEPKPLFEELVGCVLSLSVERFAGGISPFSAHTNAVEIN